MSASEVIYYASSKHRGNIKQKTKERVQIFYPLYMGMKFLIPEDFDDQISSPWEDKHAKCPRYPQGDVKALIWLILGSFIKDT